MNNVSIFDFSVNSDREKISMRIPTIIVANYHMRESLNFPPMRNHQLNSQGLTFPV